MVDFQGTDRFRTSFANLKKAFLSLSRSISTPVSEPRDRSGIIKDFELTYELTWNCLKKFLEQEGHEIKSARDAFKKAYSLGYLQNEELWLNIIKDRNLTVHTYDESFAQEMVDHIKRHHFGAFQELVDFLEKKASES